MSPEQTVNAFIAAIERGDLDAAIGHLSPDQKTEFQVIRQAASGDVVMNERIDRMQVGDKQLQLAVAGVFEVKDGKIVLWRDYFDLAAFNSQMA